MFLHSIKISNYKSLGLNENVIYFDQHVTAIIGKNESGKSNILELLSKLNLINGLPYNVFKEMKNKNHEDKSIEISIKFIHHSESLIYKEGVRTKSWTSRGR